jgi:hypothetical protein
VNVSELDGVLGELCLCALSAGRAATRATHQDEIMLAGPERYLALGPGVRRALHGASMAAGLLALGAVQFGGGLDWISALLSTFFGATMLRRPCSMRCDDTSAARNIGEPRDARREDDAQSLLGGAAGGGGGEGRPEPVTNVSVVAKLDAS